MSEYGTGIGIGNKIVFDVNGEIEDFTFILSRKNFSHLGAIQNIERNSINYKGNLNSAQEITFIVYKELDNNTEELWKEICDFKLVWVRELNQYFEIHLSTEESNELLKTVVCTSLCESELSQLNATLEVNNENDPNWSSTSSDNYIKTVFCDFNNENASLLHRLIKDKAPHYKIGHVDSSLMKLQRSFSFSDVAIYDALTNTIAKEFNCIFIFDSSTRTINAYDLYTVCNNTKCNHRNDDSDFYDKNFNHVCPKCGSTNLSYFGTDTTIFVDNELLGKDIKLEIDDSSVKNCFKLVAGDEVITSIVRELNMNGSDRIYNFPQEQLSDMSDELVNRMSEYDSLYNSKENEYEQLLNNMYEAYDKINYYKYTMMPTVETYEVTAETEGKKLTVENLSPLGVANLSTVSQSTVESYLLNYAKVFVKTGYVKLEIKTNSWSKTSTKGTWNGYFIVTNYSDEEDIYTTENLTIIVNDNYEEFLTQKIKKEISSSEDEDSVLDVLEINDLAKFKEALTLYCSERLSSFLSAIQSALDVLVEQSQSNESSEFYNSFYSPYYEKLVACQNELNLRDNMISEWEDALSQIKEEKSAIQKELNFKDYLGDTLYKEFCSYVREQVYENQNYVSDNLTDAEQIELAKEFIQKAKQELVKSSSYQYTISTTLQNLLLIPAFKSLFDYFELGNFIRIKVDDYIYRLRLISYEFDFSNLNEIQVTFSDVVKEKNIDSALNDIVNTVSSISGTYSYVSQQAEKGEVANRTFEQIFNEGLNSALVTIKNNINEDIVIDKHGIWGRQYSDITGEYDPEQIRITHNILCFTDDNWATTRAALGKHDYYKYIGGKLVKDTAYGLTSDFVTSGYVNSSQIIGGEIYSTNFIKGSQGTYFDLINGDFQLAGGKIMYNSSDNKMEMQGVTIQWDGDNSVNAPNIDDIKDLSSTIASLNKDIEDAQTSATKAYTYADNLKEASDKYADSRMSELDGKVAGYLTAGGKTSIGSDYILSPYIGGGYLNITSNNKKVIIDPNNYTGTGYIFQVHNGSEISVGITSNGSASFKGDIVANSLTLGTGVTIPSASIDGIDDYAKKTDLPTSVKDLGLDTSKIIYKGDITQTTKKDSNGIEYVETVVPSSNGSTITYSTYDADDYMVFGREKGTNSDGKDYICISKEGLLTARNAWIYGTVYATDGEFTGTITAKNGSIAGFTISNEKLYAGTGEDNDGVMIQSCSSDSNRYWVFAAGSNTHVTYREAPFRVSKYGELFASKAVITGEINATSGSFSGSINSTTGNIAGFTITNGKLYSGTGENNDIVAIQSCDESRYWAFAAGGTTHETYAKSPFRVSKYGELYAIKGVVGGWTLEETLIKSNNDENGFRVYLHCPTELGTSGNGNADVLVVRNGTSSDNYTYPFVLSSDGSFTATKANITGTINATSGSFSGSITSTTGYIGGFKITENYLYNGINIGTANSCGMSATDNYRVFWAGDGAFRVNSTGYVYCSAIEAVGGYLGGWTITSNQIKKEDTTNGFQVRLHCPTELGTSGNGNADVLVIRNGTSSSNYTYPFILSSDGSFTATKANITGTITSSSGYIGGFKIIDGYLYNGITIGTANSCGISSGTAQGGDDNYMFWAGNGAFRVTATGYVYCSNAEIKGKVTATSGSFKGSVTATSGSFNGTITSSSSTITGGSFKVDGSSSSDVRISVSYGSGYKTAISPYSVTVGVSPDYSSMNSMGFYVYKNGSAFTYASSSGYYTEGTKSRIATTEDYGKRLLYCYETPTPTFGDIGEGAIDETGKCYVFLDDIFAETIDTDCSYQVFLQSYGKGECYVTERTSSYFIVEGTANLSFGWEIKSVQLGYDTMRLEEFSEENIIYKENSIAEETYSYLESLLFTTDDQEYPNESEEIE